MKKLLGNKQGFNVMELLLVMAVLSMLYGISLINVGAAQQSSEINSTLDVLISDIRTQQLKAMLGDTEGRAAADHYGIYFQQNQYTLFHGSTYNANDSSNFTVQLDQTLQFVTPITLPSSTVVFNQVSGEIVGFTPGSNTVTLKNNSGGVQKTVTFNQFGVITQVN